VRFERAEEAKRLVKEVNGATIVEGPENKSSVTTRNLTIRVGKCQ